MWIKLSSEVRRLWPAIQEWQNKVVTTAAITNKGAYVSHASEAMRPVVTRSLVSAAFLSAFGLHSPACWGSAAEQAGLGPRRERRLKAANNYRSRPWNLMLIIPSVWERVCAEPSQSRGLTGFELDQSSAVGGRSFRKHQHLDNN